MTTPRMILDQLESYLNHHITLETRVDWAERTLIEPSVPETEDADRVMGVLMDLGAADTDGFPLTWEILSDFMTRLGGTVRVVVQSSSG